MPNTTRCKKCKAPMLWFRTPRGKYMCVDPKTEVRVLIEDGIAHMVPTYTPHWATCPYAKDFKKEDD